MPNHEMTQQTSFLAFFRRHLVWLWLVLTVVGVGAYFVAVQVLFRSAVASAQGFAAPGGVGAFSLITLSCALIVGAIKRGQLHRETKNALNNFYRKEGRRWRFREVDKIGALILVLMVMNFADKGLSYLYLSAGAGMVEIGPLNSVLFPNVGPAAGLLMSAIWVALVCAACALVLDWAWRTRRHETISWIRKVIIGAIVVYTVVIVFGTSVFLTAICLA